MKHFLQFDSFKRTCLFIIVLIIAFGQSAYAQSTCDAELSVEKDRRYKSISEKGALFTLILENTSGKNQSYTITTKQLEKDCSSKSRKSIKANSKVNVVMVNDSYKTSESNILTVDANKKKLFRVLVTAPDGTPLKTWGCIEVIAKAQNCKSKGSSTILSAYVSDNSEE